jgi:tRNA-Thr(GGU) m(6)t(6)A37 methyltransferase TsaA
MKDNELIHFTPIGYVKTAVKHEYVKNRQHTSEIILRTDLIAALEGLNQFSHVFVIYWFHSVSAVQRKTLKVHPRGRQELPILGAFATRTSFRPNPIGLTVAELLHIERNTILVRGLDAYDGTPVLDLKPVDNWDSNLKLRVPEWWTKLEQRRDTSNNEK